MGLCKDSPIIGFFPKIPRPIAVVIMVTSIVPQFFESLYSGVLLTPLKHDELIHSLGALHPHKYEYSSLLMLSSLKNEVDPSPIKSRIPLYF